MTAGQPEGTSLEIFSNQAKSSDCVTGSLSVCQTEETPANPRAYHLQAELTLPFPNSVLNFVSTTPVTTENHRARPRRPSGKARRLFTRRPRGKAGSAAGRGARGGAPPRPAPTAAARDVPGRTRATNRSAQPLRPAPARAAKGQRERPRSATAAAPPLLSSVILGGARSADGRRVPRPGPG